MTPTAAQATERLTDTRTPSETGKIPREALPSDGLARFIGAGAWAAIAGGPALAASLLLEWLVVPYEQVGQAEAYLTSSYLLSSGLRLLSTVLLVWALIGIYERQSRAAGTFGLWAFVVAFLGTVLDVGATWAEVFVWPTLAQVAPTVMEGQATETPVYLATGIAVTPSLLGLGWILFGTSTLFRACVYPRWAGVLLIVSIPATMFLPHTQGTFWESIGQIMFGIAVAALGWHALRMAPSSTSSTSDLRLLTARSPAGRLPRLERG
jgi:hypothetical protein